MNYAPLIMTFIAFVFYYGVRFYLNKYKNLNLPLIPERYYDDAHLTLIQAIITIIGMIIGYGVVLLISKIF